MRIRHLRTVALCVAVAVFLLACDLTALGIGSSAKPTIVIQAPGNATEFREGDEIAIQTAATDAGGVASIDLFVDGVAARTDKPQAAPGGNLFTLTQKWKATAGTHTLSVRAYNSSGVASDLATVTISVAPVAAQLPPSTPPPLPTTVLPPFTLAPTTLTPAPEGSAGFDGTRALKHVQMLAGNIGKRVAGSEEGRQAADYLQVQFQSYGYQVVEQRFPFTAFIEKDTKLDIVTPVSKNVSTAALIYSPSGHFKAEVVAVPNPGIAADFAKVDLKGKIALVQRGQTTLREKAGNAARAGAIAVLIYNSAPQVYLGTLQEPAQIPALALSGTDGQTFLDLLKQGPVTAQLNSETEIGPRDGINVVATRRGTSSDVLVFGGHYDTVNNSFGANDNASGIAVVLELARVLAQANRPETFVFVGFDGEELGLCGSKAYVNALSSEERSHVKAMFNFDEVGTTDNQLLFIGSEMLVNWAVTTAQQLKVNARATTLSSGGSDHESFISAGISAIFFYREDSNFHTPQDTLDRVRADWLATAARVAMEMINSPLPAPSVAASRTVTPQTLVSNTPAPVPPTVAPATAAPALPPGIYVSAVALDPPEPKNGQYPTFNVTFINTLGQTVYYKWFVKIYDPDARQSMGETAKVDSTFLPGTSTQPSAANWKAIGASPCRQFIARVFYQTADNAVVEFPKPDGGTFQYYFAVCP